MIHFENLRLVVKQCYLTSDRSLLIGLKLVENAKLKKFDFLVIFKQCEHEIIIHARQ